MRQRLRLSCLLARVIILPYYWYVSEKRRPSPAEYRAQSDLGSRLSKYAFRAYLEALGIPFDVFAIFSNVHPATVNNWAAGSKPIPYGVPNELAAIRADTDAAIKAIAAGLPHRVPLDVDYGERWRRVATVRAAELIGFTGDLTEALTPPK